MFENVFCPDYNKLEKLGIDPTDVSTLQSFVGDVRKCLLFLAYVAIFILIFSATYQYLGVLQSIGGKFAIAAIVSVVLFYGFTKLLRSMSKGNLGFFTIASNVVSDYLIGHYAVFFIDKEGKIAFRIGRTLKELSSIVSNYALRNYCAVRLGGVFKKRKINLYVHGRARDWLVASRCHSPRDVYSSFKASIIDEAGISYDFSIQKILLYPHSFSGPPSWETLLGSVSGALKTSSVRLDKASEAIEQAIKDIHSSRQFIKSNQAQDIRMNLAGVLADILDFDDPNQIEYADLYNKLWSEKQHKNSKAIV